MKIEIQSQRKKGRMARRLVYFCVFMLTAAAVWAAVVKTCDSATDLSDVLTFIGAAFGGELLLLLVKRVFAKENSNSEGESEWNN